MPLLPSPGAAHTEFDPPPSGNALAWRRLFKFSHMVGTVLEAKLGYMTTCVGLGSCCVTSLVTVYQPKKSVRSVARAVNTPRTE